MKSCTRRVIHNANQVLTLSGASYYPKCGRDLADIGIIEGGSLAIEGDRIVFVGDKKEVEQEIRSRWGSQGVDVIDATGKVVMPGLIDPHTHLIYAGSREYELPMRLAGADYLDILQAGGGILATTQMTRRASEEELMEQSRQRLDRFLLHGVTTLEVKSGYGLTVEDECKQLRVARRLNQQHPIDLVPTFMGAHAVPDEYKEDPGRYVDLVIHDMIPKVAKEDLAEFCDVFCEKGVFTLEESRQILEAGKRYGLKPKIHADEIKSMGGAELAASVEAISADHLLQASEEGMHRLSEAGVVAVLLPGTAFFLMKPYAKARQMIDCGVPVALSTDCNPGSSPTQSLLFIMNLACFHMKMHPSEVIAACTINAAHAIARAQEIGSLEVGKKADILILDVPDYLYLQYQYGMNPVDTVIKNGNIVIQAGRRLCEVSNSTS